SEGEGVVVGVDDVGDIVRALQTFFGVGRVDAPDQTHVIGQHIDRPDEPHLMGLCPYAGFVHHLPVEGDACARVGVGDQVEGDVDDFGAVIGSGVPHGQLEGFERGEVYDLAVFSGQVTDDAAGLDVAVVKLDSGEDGNVLRDLTFQGETIPCAM
ncbi:MAG TPA: hypothetical protein PLJ43_07825, partial [Chitinophagales bacterium]|nr:hypothetical protein [Chitinophagales bacterium]